MGEFILGIIPARGGSKGLPKKNIRLLGGLPLIAHTIEAARQSRYLCHTVISTEDEEIARIARKHGGEVPFLRPGHLAQDDTPTVPVLRHAVEVMERRLGVRADPVVLMEPTSPFRTAADIDACIERYLEIKPDVVFSAQRSEANPYYNLVEGIPGTPWVRLCKEPPETLNRRQEAPAAWISHGAVITYGRDALFRYEHHLRVQRLAVVEMPEERIFDIDSERDLLVAESLLERSRITKGDPHRED